MAMMTLAPLNRGVSENVPLPPTQCLSRLEPTGPVAAGLDADSVWLDWDSSYGMPMDDTITDPEYVIRALRRIVV